MKITKIDQSLNKYVFSGDLGEMSDRARQSSSVMDGELEQRRSALALALATYESLPSITVY